MQAATISFVTRFDGAAQGGVRQYEQGLFPYLSNLAPITLAPIEPWPARAWAVRAFQFVRRDLKGFLASHPCYIPSGPHTRLAHISNEVLALALLWYRGLSVVTVHHLPPIWDREFQREAGLEWPFYLLAMLGIRRATRIVADSQWTSEEVQRHLRVPAERIDVAPLAVNTEVFRPLERDPSLQQKYGLGKGPYILYVGGFERRKNLAVLLRAFAQVRAQLPTAELLLAGPVGRSRQALEQGTIVLPSGSKLLGFVSVDDLAGLYNLATVFVMPSMLEGFSLPVLEAMSCGCPVIASGRSAPREIVGDAGVLFDPQDTDGLVQALLQVLENADLRSTMAERGLLRARQYDWQRTAELTIAAYQRAAPNIV